MNSTKFQCRVKTDIHGGNPGAVAKKLGLKKISPVKFDFSVNVNPFGMPPAVDHFLKSADERVYTAYPEIFADSAASALAKVHGVRSESVLVGNGSTEIFSWIIQTLKPGKTVWLSPTYSGYSDVCHALGFDGSPVFFAKSADNFKIDFKKLKNFNYNLMFICRPNNPTGVLIEKKQIIDLAFERDKNFYVIDESFIDFLPDAKCRSLINCGRLPENIIVVKSLTKFFAIAGIRLGMAYGSSSLIRRLSQARLPWSVNAVAQAIVPLLYIDRDYIREIRGKIRGFRERLAGNLAELPELKIYPSTANFILCEIRTAMTADKLQKELLKKGILIRSCSGIEGLGQKFFRVAVLGDSENTLLVDCLSDIFRRSNVRFFKPFSSKLKVQGSKLFPLMVVGTSSGSGKSLVTAAFCRYFVERGIGVAPFKAQNMSLNSFVTKEGGEIGRAQAVQATAAKVEPHTDMNPVLLKPTGEAGSQLIVRGKPVCNITAKSYYEKKCGIRKEAQKAFDRLSHKFDLIVMEGAGSPAEINLQDKDFVNMSMAEYVGAKTLLVADIDRGGVFASIYGTVKLLPSKYRKLLSGIIINKFRGDMSLLKNGIEEIEKLTGIPVLGVIPYLRDLRFEEEDSLGLENRNLKSKTQNHARIALHGSRQPECKILLDIAVIRLPRISNYTDFLPFETLDGVSLRYVSAPEEIRSPDLIFLPGTKNTIADTKFLRDKGFENVLTESVRERNIPLFGICGGYQILGTEILDSCRTESDVRRVRGLGLLPVKTVLRKEKELAQVKGVTNTLPFVEKGTPFAGYEIHMGKTFLSDGSKTGKSAVLKITEKNGKKCKLSDGIVSCGGLAFGTYVHGFFDSTEIRNSLLRWLCRRKGVEADELGLECHYDAEKIFDTLAEIVKKHVDMKRIESMLHIVKYIREPLKIRIRRVAKDF